MRFIHLHLFLIKAVLIRFFLEIVHVGEEVNPKIPEVFFKICLHPEKNPQNLSEFFANPVPTIFEPKYLNKTLQQQKLKNKTIHHLFMYIPRQKGR